MRQNAQNLTLVAIPRTETVVDDVVAKMKVSFQHTVFSQTSKIGAFYGFRFVVTTFSVDIDKRVN